MTTTRRRAALAASLFAATALVAHATDVRAQTAEPSAPPAEAAPPQGVQGVEPAARPEPTPPPAPLAPAAPPDEPKAKARSIQEFDVQPTVRVLKSNVAEIHVGGIVQIHAAPHVGSDALIANNDPASDPGFRLRRAGFGIQGRLLEKFGAIVAVNAVQSGTDADRAISNAVLFWEAGDPLLLTVGTVKVPYSRAALESSRTLTGIERPLAVNVITPARRLGVTAEGHLFNNHVSYLAGVMNGTEGFALGNQFGGLLGGARLEVYPWAPPDPWERRDGLAVAADGIYANEPSTERVGYSVDLYGAYAGAHLKIEAMCDQLSPKDAVVISPTLPDTLRRCGAYAETGWVLPFDSLPLQPMARIEIMDDNRAIADAGDVAILDTGLNMQIIKRYVRAQAHYIGRYELRGPSRDNDAVVLTLLGAF